MLLIYMIQLFLQKEAEKSLSQNWVMTSEICAALNALFIHLHIILSCRYSADTKEKWGEKVTSRDLSNIAVRFCSEFQHCYGLQISPRRVLPILVSGYHHLVLFVLLLISISKVFSSLLFSSLLFSSLLFSSLLFSSLRFASLRFASLPFPSLPFRSLPFPSFSSQEKIRQKAEK